MNTNTTIVDKGKEIHQTTITDSPMEGLSADQATVKFTGTVNYDGNGKVTGTTWDANDRTYGTIKTPAVEGYTTDKPSVDGETVLPNDSSLNREYKVVYTQNRYRLTEKFVDEDGYELSPYLRAAPTKMAMNQGCQGNPRLCFSKTRQHQRQVW